MTQHESYSGVLPSVAGRRRFITYDANGFPSQGLQALHLFTEGAGTSVADEVGGSAATIEHPVASNNAFSWLAGGGGLHIEGTEIVTMAAFDVTAGPWTILSGGAITGTVGADVEKIGALIAFRDWTSGSDLRGALMGLRDMSTGPTRVLRPTDGAGGQSAVQTVISGVEAVEDVCCLNVMAYDGSLLTGSVYAGDGSLICGGQVAVSEATFTTGSGAVVDLTLQPIIGGPNAIYDGGAQDVEFAARFDRILDATEIAAVIAFGVATGAARSRPWL